MHHFYIKARLDELKYDLAGVDLLQLGKRGGPTIAETHRRGADSSSQVGLIEAKASLSLTTLVRSPGKKIPVEYLVTSSSPFLLPTLLELFLTA